MEIIYVKVVDRNIVIKTPEGYIEGSLTNQLDLLLSEEGYARFNQNVIGKISKIKSLDPILRMAYFDGDDVNSIQLSRRNIRHVSTLFDQFHAF